MRSRLYALRTFWAASADHVPLGVIATEAQERSSTLIGDCYVNRASTAISRAHESLGMARKVARLCFYFYLRFLT
jgi:hypothetical protein